VWVLGAIEPDRKDGDACLGRMVSVAWVRLGGVAQWAVLMQFGSRTTHLASVTSRALPPYVDTSRIQEVIEA
jgi:hypothetical protein